MNRLLSRQILAAHVTTIIITLLCCTEAVARAGGGGGERGAGTGNRILDLALTVSAILWIIIAISFAAKKEKNAVRYMTELEKIDPSWETSHLKWYVRRAFYALQNSWRERNQKLAKEYMSNRLYSEHKAMTDEMIANHEQNVLEAICLFSAKIVEVLDYRDSSKDKFTVFISGAMIDYVIDTKTNKLLRGDQSRTTCFTELWYFIRENGAWVVDEIDDDAGIAKLSRLTSFSEELPTKLND